jgi:hypothetical protein
VNAAVNRKALEGLRDKYAEMLAMRMADGTGDIDDEQTRVRMARLSSLFPGALREIDDLELSEIKSRIAKLNVVLREEGGVERWMEAIIEFHALARGALCVKRWLARRKRVDAQVESAFAAAAPALAFPEDACRWTGDLARIAAPPRGRVLDVVFERMARELGISEPTARVLVFGVPRRERVRRGRQPTDEPHSK